MEPHEIKMENETICAISTPPGVGGIAVIRVSGPEAIGIVDKIFNGSKPLSGLKTHTAHFGTITSPDGQPLDEVVTTIFKSPHSFTGEDTVEISTHGSLYIQQELLNILIHNGCRLAHAGEFTRRAFTNGRLDLARAEAVADIIAARSKAAHRLAASQMKGDFSRRLKTLRDSLTNLAALLELELDFSEEDVTFASREHLMQIATDVNKEINRLHDSFAAGNAIRNGIPVAIVGATNAGKSSLLNTLIGDDRAIVSNIHGTTRDTVEETITIGDYQFRFIDTAGIRDSDDTIEKIGIERSLRAMEQADIILHVNDISCGIDRQIAERINNTTRLRQDATPQVITILNKIDIADSTDTKDQDIIKISTVTGAGIKTLRERLLEIAHGMISGLSNGDIIVTNTRHVQALSRSSESSRRLIDGLNTDLPGDLIAQDLRETINHLATITGDIPSSEILNTIFSRFCIGK